MIPISLNQIGRPELSKRELPRGTYPMGMLEQGVLGQVAEYFATAGKSKNSAAAKPALGTRTLAGTTGTKIHNFSLKNDENPRIFTNNSE